MKNLNTLGWVAIILLLVGGINLGLMGLINVDIIGAILGNLLSRLIFILIGAAAVYYIYFYIYKKEA